MNTDTFLKIGSSHNICEDYVLSKENHDTNSISVCLADGCSSAQYTDIGARLICHAKLAGKECNLQDIVYNLGLPNECLYTTYLELKYEEGEDKQGRYIKCTRYGDGFLVLGMQNFRILITEYKFSENKPYYLGYELFEQEQLFDKDKQNLIQSLGYGFNPDLSLDWKLPSPENTLKKERYNIYTKYIKWAAILSDGLSSFTDKQNNLIPIQNLVPYLLNFKTFHGEFVKRTMRAAFKKFDELGWKNTDDFSIGVLNFN